MDFDTLVADYIGTVSCVDGLGISNSAYGLLTATVVKSNQDQIVCVVFVSLFAC